MNKIIVILSFYFWYILPFYAQTNYFNNRYDFYNYSGILHTLEIDSGYLCVGGYLEDILWNQKIGMIFIGKKGEEIWRKSFGEYGFDYYAGMPGSFIITRDKSFALAGGITDSTGNDDILFIKYDKDFNIIWKKIYGNKLYFDTGRQCKQTLDGGYIIIGTANNNFWLIKTDSMGTIEWDRTFGGAGFEEGRSVNICKDGGYIVTGASSYTTYPYSDILVIKTDSLGNKQWSRRFGGVSYDYPSNIEQTKDGGYIIGGNYATKLHSWPNEYFSKPYIIKLDSAGNTEWEKTYGPSTYTSSTITMIHELRDGSFIATGTIGDIYSEWPVGLVLKVSSKGDSIFYRTHKKLTGNSSRNILEDIKPTSDNGFIAGGSILPDFPDTGKQNIWILKLDSMGCAYAGCDTTLGIMNFNISDYEMNIYPNPFTENTVITTLVPDNVKTSELIVADITGRVIKKYSLHSGYNQIEILSGELQHGIYFYSLVIADLKVITKKMIHL